MLYYICFTDGGVPKTGLTPIWNCLATGENGTDKSGSAPAISEIDATNLPGWYKLEIVFGTTPWDVVAEDLLGWVDGGSALTDADRYKPVAFTKRGLGLGVITNEVDDEETTLRSEVGMMGSGAISWILTVKDAESNPIDNVGVWVTTDVAGTNLVGGTLYTNANGQVTFTLDIGSYYAWKEKAGFNFSNPQPFTVTED